MSEKNSTNPDVSQEKNDPNAIIAQFQVMQQQLQNVLMQKETLSIGLMEIERASDELKKSMGADAYKITGTVMVKKPVDDIKRDMAESKEALEIRLKSVEKSEKLMTDKLKELQEKLQAFMK